MTTAQLSITGPQHDVPESVCPTLATILQWPRPHGSYGDLEFRKWLTEQIIAAGYTPAILAEGCIHVDVPGPKNAKSKTLFSSHVDTQEARIHGDIRLQDGKMTRGTKQVMYDAVMGTLFLDPKTPNGGCLGADDGIGVWIMLRMIQANVPGGYIFNTGEECGGIGSSAMRDKHPELLKTYNQAVAFDRPGTDEIITHQRGGTRCASDAYATALCAKLNKRGFDFKPSTRGVFTDTFNFRKLIAECINVGVGYTGQHGPSETQDYAHAAALLDVCCAIDWSTLPIGRDPATPDPVVQPAWAGRNDWMYDSRAGVYQGRGLWDDAEPFERSPVKPPKQDKKFKNKSAPPPAFVKHDSVFEDVLGMKTSDIEIMCQDAADEFADLMRSLCIEVAQLRAEVMVLRKMGGNL